MHQRSPAARYIVRTVARLAPGRKVTIEMTSKYPRLVPPDTITMRLRRGCAALWAPGLDPSNGHDLRQRSSGQPHAVAETLGRRLTVPPVGVAGTKMSAQHEVDLRRWNQLVASVVFAGMSQEGH
jgi:hypothetical protein